jgi:SPP1 gp7 family putative phage head morphogenesis protein
VTPSQILDFLEIFTGDAFDVPPEIAISYFQAKGLRPTFSYADMLGDAHNQAFTVAKMMDLDLLAYTRKSLDDALNNGESYNDWRRNLEPTLKKAGWWGRDADGNQLGSPSRIQNIFRTNMQSAYAVGQWDEIESQADIAPYLMYDAIDDTVTRPEHRAWDRKVLPVKHNWWKTHFPPNGFNCRCSVIQMDEDEAEALGLQIDTRAPYNGSYTWTNPRTHIEHKIPNGLDPGFNRNPGMPFLKHLQRLAAEKIVALPDDMSVVAKRALAPVLDAEILEEVAQAAIAAAATDAAISQQSANP